MRHRPIAQDSPPTQFGMFYPVGYLAVAFRHEDDAGRARDALVAGGYDSGDVQLVSAREVIAGATRSLETASPLVRVLGWERDALAAHAELAARGFTSSWRTRPRTWIRNGSWPWCADSSTDWHTNSTALRSTCCERCRNVVATPFVPPGRRS